MFQLEEQLRDWRQRFLQAETMEQADVEELESHVRESIAALTASGLAEEEAFLVATRRVGEPSSLSREFGKVNGHRVWGRRAFWMVAGCLLFDLVRLLIATVASLGQVVASFASSNGTVVSLAYLGVSVGCWVAVVTCLSYWAKKKRGGSFVSIIANSNGIVLGVCLLLSVIAAKLIQAGSHIFVVRMTPAEEFGRAALTQFWVNGVLVALVPLVLLTIMLQLRRATRESTGSLEA